MFYSAAEMGRFNVIAQQAEKRLCERERISPASRLLDVAIAACALAALAPLLMLISAVIYLADPGPILFGHRRIGYGGKFFRCWKFRTMVTDAEARLNALLETDPIALAEWNKDHKLRQDPRITAVGRFLRLTSLDELPQFFNVLQGSMSLVGPRPIVSDEALRYGRYMKHYCSVRPGITGLWQVSGRNNVSYRRRVAIDVSYIRSKTLKTDMWILYRTVPAVLFAKGSC